MAVEIPCPKCRAEITLSHEPDPGAELVVCPRCEHTFPYQPAAGKPKKKKKKAAAADEKAAAGKEKKPADEKKAADGAKPAGEKGKAPRKRKAKKKKTPPAVIAGIVVGALMIVGTVSAVLIFYLTKKSSGQEMMSYLPAECDEVTGVNVGHLRKYPGFYESCKASITPTGFHEAGELFAKANGQDFDSAVDYVIQGAGESGGRPLGATVLRATAEFDPGVLAKIPGAKKYTLAGVDYFTVTDLPKLGYRGLRVFAPTNKLVVFLRGDMPDAAFRSALTGNKDAPDGAVYARSGALGKATSRGTVWQFTLYGKTYNPPPRPKDAAGGQDADVLFKDDVAGVLGGAQGYGLKASVGSRDTRGEWIVWYRDSDAATEMLRKWKEKPWVKDDEENPPRYWRNMSYKSGLGKTAENVIRDGLSFRSSGELFTIRTQAETKMLQMGVGGLVNQFNPRPSPE